MRIVISGASGFVGRRLARRLAEDGHGVGVLSRRTGAFEVLAGADAVIHLAGEPVAQRWTAAARQRIRDSRILGTRNLVAALGALEAPPKVLVCASAIGYYGSRGGEVLTEASPPGQGFLADLCVEWEREAEGARPLGVRVVRVRIGVVLDGHGGALAKMLPAFRLCAGGTMGAGKQWMSWIHLDDLCGLIAHSVTGPLDGAVNGTAPNPVTNWEFTRTLARALGRPALVPVPAFALRAVFGEMASILLDSQRALPGAALASGFQFQYPELPGAFENLLPR